MKLQGGLPFSKTEVAEPSWALERCVSKESPSRMLRCEASRRVQAPIALRQNTQIQIEEVIGAPYRREF
jgi:hypothetical protein